MISIEMLDQFSEENPLPPDAVTRCKYQVMISVFKGDPVHPDFPEDSYDAAEAVFDLLVTEGKSLEEVSKITGYDLTVSGEYADAPLTSSMLEDLYTSYQLFAQDVVAIYALVQEGVQ